MSRIRITVASLIVSLLSVGVLAFVVDFSGNPDNQDVAAADTTSTSTTSTTIDPLQQDGMQYAINREVAIAYVTELKRQEEWAAASYAKAKADAAAAAQAKAAQPKKSTPKASSSTQTTPVQTSSGGGCVLPSHICQRESGNSYTAVNSSSGAGGMYQFMPSTWNGVAAQIAPEWIGVAPQNAPPAVQDQFASYLWNGGAGCSHWVTCSG